MRKLRASSKWARVALRDAGVTRVTGHSVSDFCAREGRKRAQAVRLGRCSPARAWTPRQERPSLDVGVFHLGFKTGHSPYNKELRGLPEVQPQEPRFVSCPRCSRGAALKTQHSMTEIFEVSGKVVWGGWGGGGFLFKAS